MTWRNLLGPARWVGYGILGMFVLTNVVNGLRAKTQVVIQPGTSLAILAIDDVDYGTVCPGNSPVTCELSPGRHVLRLEREGRPPYEESFVVVPGHEMVLTAWGEQRTLEGTLRVPPTRTELAGNALGHPR